MATTAANPPAEVSRAHPLGLYVLFGTEAWERFSYYGMRALLVLYLTKQLQFGETEALGIYGLYTGLVYLTPLIGGYVADTYLGTRKAITVGGFLMMLGQFALMSESLVYLGMMLLIVGNGFFKPNVSTIVGSIYPPGDARRDGGFTIFYMGINLGALFSPLICSTLGETYGWAYGFGSAGVGMAVGLAMFIAAQVYIISVPQGEVQEDEEDHSLTAPAPPPEESTMPILAERSSAPTGRGVDDDDENDPTVVYSKDQLRYLDEGLLDEDPSDVFEQVGHGAELTDDEGEVIGVPTPAEPPAALARTAHFNLRDWRDIAVSVVIAGGIAGAISLAWAAKGQPGVLGAGALVLAVLVGLEALLSKRRGKGAQDTSPPLTRQDWHRTGVILLLAMFTIFFWMGFEQAGGTFSLFADTRTNRVVGGFTIPAGWFQSVNPLMILGLAPLFSLLWGGLARTRFNPSTPVKMGFGLIFLAAGFGVMGMADQIAGADGMVGPMWLVVAFLLHTMGELCLSPIGLSMVTKLAPLKLASLLMGLWFAATATANYMAGVLPAIMESAQLPLYWFLVAVSTGAALVLFALSPVITKYMYGRG
ncbi:MAG: peptide MFS transporter [Deltaproteobacteria bacterium]|nr:peptide MFS transporter [Deltaproteobacteria bacterium]